MIFRTNLVVHLKTADSRFEITFNISDNNNSSYAKVMYLDNTTRGFDAGFDGKLLMEMLILYLFIQI